MYIAIVLHSRDSEPRMEEGGVVVTTMKMPELHIPVQVVAAPISRCPPDAQPLGD